MKNLYDEFAELVISSIHELPYKEAMKIEESNLVVAILPEDIDLYPSIGIEGSVDEFETVSFGGDITIGRVMQAFNNKDNNSGWIDFELAGYEQVFLIFNQSGVIQIMCADGELKIIVWKLTKENGQECTHLDQSEKTIKALIKLLTCTKHVPHNSKKR